MRFFNITIDGIAEGLFLGEGAFRAKLPPDNANGLVADLGKEIVFDIPSMPRQDL